MLDDPLHFSEISTFLRCAKLHEFVYINEVVPRRTHRKIAFGTLGHAALKAFILKEDPHQMVEQEIQHRFADDLSTSEEPEIRMMAPECIQVAERAYDQIKQYHVVLCEKPLEMVVDGIKYVGTPDLVIEDHTGVWVVDHKYRAAFRPYESELVNLQMIFYQRLVFEALGLETAGSRQFQIKPAAPKVPELTKAGTLSKANINTDWATYERCLIDKGLDPAQYQDMKEKLKDKQFFDFDQTKARRSMDEILRAWDEIIIPASHEIRHNKFMSKHSKCQALRTMNWSTCQSCNHLDYCTEDLRGGDLEYLRSSKYKLKGEESFVQVVVEDIE